MRILIQRVLSASVEIEGATHSSIGQGLMVLLGIESEDGAEDIEWLTSKLTKLRIFDDENGVMNLDVTQVQGDVMVVSQFTLQASTKKGNRPSYIKAAGEAISKPIYNSFVQQLSSKLGQEVKTGEFGADMKISLINNGPVTIWIDSKNRE
ncbi:MAG: D-aminoacyl-tRNA deacylase [Rikenellaceae bacterium]